MIGVVRGFLDGLVTGEVTDRGIGATYLLERIALVVLLRRRDLALARRDGQRSESAWPRASAAVAAILVAVTLRNWSTDVQFLRAGMEAWGLSVLVLTRSPSPWARRAIYLAGLVTVGVSLLYLVRV